MPIGSQTLTYKRFVLVLTAGIQIVAGKTNAFAQHIEKHVQENTPALFAEPVQEGIFFGLFSQILGKVLHIHV